MKLRVLGVCAVFGLVIATSGCSLQEVQLWFQFNKHVSITAAQAKTIGDLVNSKRSAGCDTRYSAGASYASSCVPNNVTSVHCAGTGGDGPAVRGPLTLTGWDAFGLDPDGDKQACVDPVGNVDMIGQVLDGVEVAGWAFDPNTTDPINVDVYDNDDGTRFLASDSRPDVDAAYPGAGESHGFDVGGDEDPGTTHKICAYAINVGAGGNQQLTCKSIQMQAEVTVNWIDDYTGMIEGADRVPGGIHVRGFLVDDSTPAIHTSDPRFSASPTFSGIPLSKPLDVVRDDVAEAFGLPSGQPYGFDFVVSTGAVHLGQESFADATQICLYAGPSTSALMMCRPIGS